MCSISLRVHLSKVSVGRYFFLRSITCHVLVFKLLFSCKRLSFFVNVIKRKKGNC